jgi:Ran-binding protein 3
LKDKTPTPSEGDQKSAENGNIFNSNKSSSSNNDNEGLLFSSALITKTTSSGSTSSSVSSTATNNEDNKTPSQEKPTQLIDFTDEKDDLKSISQQSINIENNKDNNNLSLIEAARRYEEMKGAQKRKYEEVEVITGEEDENNILEINCKLFTFDKNNWEERGRGMLRLNDTKNSSRVVFRASGSLRVLLNTKVWSDQMCQKPSAKSLRLTAFDTTGVMKVYLVMGRNEDIQSLFDALGTRIEREKERKPIVDDDVNNSSNSSQDGNNEETDENKCSPEPATKKLATSVE